MIGGIFEFGIWWLLEKSQDASLQKRYDCPTCLAENWINEEPNKWDGPPGRTCLLYNTGFPTPVMPEEFGERWTPDNAAWKSDFTAEELFIMAGKALSSGGFPQNISFYQFVRRMFPNVCPESLLSTGLFMLNQIEAMCFDYKCLPEAGGVLDQDAKLTAIMNTIRETKNAFDIALAEKTKQKSNKGN